MRPGRRWQGGSISGRSGTPGGSGSASPAGQRSRAGWLSAQEAEPRSGALAPSLLHGVEPVGVAGGVSPLTDDLTDLTAAVSRVGRVGRGRDEQGSVG